MNYREIACKILKNVGGKENVSQVTHCFTRLRFVLKDKNLANKEVLEQTEGVISVVIAGGEYQVVCGAKVNSIYEAVMECLGHNRKEQSVEESRSFKDKEPLLNRVLQVITQMFTPLIPAIAAAGLIKGLLTAAKLIMQKNGVDLSTTDTYQILYSASQVIFYFFPIFLAMTSAKALKCNQVIAMVIAGTLVYPSIDSMIQNVSVSTTLFGIPVIKGAWQIGDAVKVFSYTESVIPIILAVLVMSYLERGLKKIVPEVVQLILVPGLELILMLPITLCVLGPIGIYIGNGIQWMYDGVIGISPILGGGLIGGLWGVFVIFGAHRALLPIGLNEVALQGRQNILAFAGAANFAQGGAALGVMLKTKDKGLKQIAASGTIAATLVGVTEPAIYGCNLRLKKPMICAVIAGAVGGAIMGAGGVYGDAFANNGVLTIFTYAAFGMTKFLFYLIGIGVAYFGAMILTYIIGFDEIQTGSKVAEIRETQIMPPIKGEVIPLTGVKDEVFASGQLGQGIAIIPTEGIVTAPCDGVVTVIFPTLHAIGFTTKDGVELLIHVGINTVRLNGSGFQALVEAGDSVKAGEVILTFDMDKITELGYDMTTPVLVTNGEQFEVITERCDQGILVKNK